MDGDAEADKAGVSEPAPEAFASVRGAALSLDGLDM
jgi:hypothetical protein